MARRELAKIAAVPVTTQAAGYVAQHEFTLQTRGRGLHEVSERVSAFVAQAAPATGIAQLFCPHTSCSLILGENADPTVLGDLERFFARLVRDGDPLFQHNAEGPDDMPAHVRSVLTANSISIPIQAGRLVLGTWQGLFLWEHRAHPHQRKLIVSVIGI
jgi:secondary thiamine-phosphate synthase enzyme